MPRRRSNRNSLPTFPGLPRVPGASRLPPTARLLVTIVVIALSLIATYLKTKTRTPTPTRGNDRVESRRPMPTTVAVGQGIVVHVADGDTIDVDFDGDGPQPATRVRLLGIDTPELHGETLAFGEAAREETVRLADHRLVTLGYDISHATKDKYGRLLAYVYLPDGSCLNDDLVRDGQAFAHRTLTCGRTPELVELENQAQSARRGFWPAMRTPQMPEWRQRWLNEQARPSR